MDDLAKKKNTHTTADGTQNVEQEKGKMNIFCHKCAYRARHFARRLAYSPLEEAAWPSAQRFGLAIRRSRVRVPLYPHARFALGRLQFRS